MITELPTDEQIEKWKALFTEYGKIFTPNRKSGAEIDEYFRNKYGLKPLKSAEFASVVEWNILNNEAFREKLRGEKPQINCYDLNGVFVGIDLVSGEFFVESDDIGKAALIYDDLFLFRGLDESDLKNFVLVGQYAELKNDRS